MGGRRLPSIVRRLLGAARAFAADCRGVSATEFALLAPLVLLPGTLIPIDLGIAAYQQMTISSAVRVAAQSAIEGGDSDDVRAVLASVASENFRIAGSETPEADDLEISVEPVTRAENGVSLTYMQVEARKAYDGILIPAAIPLGASMLVALQ